MDIFEFEQAIIDGQITDFRPYVENGDFVKIVTEKHFASGTVWHKNSIQNGLNRMTQINTMIGSNCY